MPPPTQLPAPPLSPSPLPPPPALRLRPLPLRLLLALPLLALFTPACREKPSPPPPPRPELVCSQPRHDFGTRIEGERLSYVFSLENRGTAPLRVLSIEKSYSCGAQNPPSRIEPRAKARLEIVCDSEKRPGRMADVVVLHTNDPRSPELKLELAAQIQPQLALEPSEALFEQSFGKTERRELRLVGKRAAEARLTLLGTDDPTPRVELLPASTQAAAGLSVTLAATRVETRIARVRLATGLDQPKELSVTVTWRISGDLAIDPSNPYFNLREPPPHERTLRVTSKRSDLKLYAVEVPEGPFEASFVRDEAHEAYSVRVRVLDAKVPEGDRGALGKLLIASNDPAEPRKIVPLFALGILAGRPAPSR